MKTIDKAIIRAAFRARRRLGLSVVTPVKHRVLFALVAEKLATTVPSGKQARLDMLLRFNGVNGESSEPAKRSKKYVRRPPQNTTWEEVNSPAFLESYAWRRLRMVVLRKRGARCECCGATPADGIVIHVDHIKPRRLFPELALVEENLQVLCEPCNHGKGSWDQTDWRAEKAPQPAETVDITDEEALRIWESGARIQ